MMDMAMRRKRRKRRKCRTLTVRRWKTHQRKLHLIHLQDEEVMK